MTADNDGEPADWRRATSSLRRAGAAKNDTRRRAAREEIIVAARPVDALNITAKPELKKALARLAKSSFNPKRRA